jgi:hypothetical protein
LRSVKGRAERAIIASSYEALTPMHQACQPPHQASQPNVRGSLEVKSGR